MRESETKTDTERHNGGRWVLLLVLSIMGLTLFPTQAIEKMDSVQQTDTEWTVETSNGVGGTPLGCMYAVCCTHSACQPLRQQSWCRYWIYLEGVSETALDKETFPAKLTACLAGIPYSFWGAQFTTETGQYGYRLFLHAYGAEPFTRGNLESLTRLATGPHENGLDLHLGCALHFQCCGLYHYDILPEYIRDILEPDKVQIGDESLRLLLGPPGCEAKDCAI